MNRIEFGCHSDPGYALHSVAAENTRQNSTLNNPSFCLDDSGHLSVSFVTSIRSILLLVIF